MAKEQGVSLKPSTFTEGGFLDDMDVKITGSEFIEFQYPDRDVIAVGLELTFEAEGLEEPATQFFSAGGKAGEFFEPSKDGNRLVGKAGKDVSKRGIGKNSNLGFFMTELIRAGVSEADVDDTAGCLIGIEGHLSRKVPSGRGNIEGAQRGVLVFTEIHGAAGSESAEKISDEDIQDVAVGKVLEILGDEGELKKSMLGSKIFNVCTKDPSLTKNQVAAIVAMTRDDGFLGGEGVPWNYDLKSKVLSM